MQHQSPKRARGTGTLIKRKTATGEKWVGQWRVDGKFVKRTLAMNSGRRWKCRRSRLP